MEVPVFAPKIFIAGDGVPPGLIDAGAPLQRLHREVKQDPRDEVWGCYLPLLCSKLTVAFFPI
jgi:hypothetical protein